MDAFNARNLDKFVSFYAPDVEVFNGQGNRMMRGHNDLRSFYGKLFERSPNLRVKIKTRIVLPDHIIDEEEISGINLEGFPAELHSAAIYRISNEKIVHAQLL